MGTYIKGNYRRSIYQNSNGYHIGLFKVIETNDEELEEFCDRTITFTGYFHELNDMDTYLFYGKIVNHEKYGKQFQVESYERCKPEEKDAIIEFLTSGLFKGIGEKKAKSIVDTLGKDTLKIILENPDNLILIPGITKANIDTLYTKLKEYEASYETIVYLGNLGFNTKDSMLVYNYYKDKTQAVIEEDIYRLVRDIYNINFKKIDQIALHIGIKKDDKIRIKASIIYIMNEVSNLYGHSYYYQEEIKSLLPRVLQVSISDELLQEILLELEKDLLIIVKDEKYYLKEMYEAESFIVKRFRLLSNNATRQVKGIDDKLKELEDFFNIDYNKDQEQAIKESYLKDFLIITGGPGTGKSATSSVVKQTKLLHYRQR